MLVFSYIALATGLVVTALFFMMAIKLLLVDRAEGKKSAVRAPSIWDAIMGRSRMTEDWIPDGRVQGGMIYNRKKKRLEISGRLSTDSLDRVFRTHSS